MWIVNIALRRPYTFLVMALLILLATPFVLRSTPTDVLPEIRIPVISIVWSYNGLSAQEMGSRVASVTERALTTTVNDIEHIESQSMAGISLVKLYFQPTANIQTAIAQAVAVSQTQLKQLPPGMTPPLIITYSASSVPVVASGGVGNLAHLVDGVTQGHASAVLAASIFHFGTHTIAEAHAALRAAGLPARG